MRNNIHTFILVSFIVGLALTPLGCQKANPADAETQAIAKQFTEAVYVTQDADLAMSLVGPIQTYPFVTRKDVESTIADFVKLGCMTTASSITLGKPGTDLNIPEISTADAARGVTARTAWLVASKYTCGTKPIADNTTLVFLEQINGKWVVSKCMFFYNTVSHFVG
jgi:hypothetical protein